MDAPDELLQQLAQVGALAIFLNLNDEAAKIYSAIELWKPNAAVAVLGQAMNRQALGDLPGALRILERGVDATPDVGKKDLLKAVLALYLKIDGQGSRSEQLRREVVESGHDPEAVSLAQDIH